MAWRRQTLSAVRTNSTVVNLLTTPTRLSGVIFDVTEDGDFVWVLSGGGSAFSYRLLLLYWPTRRWVAEMPLPQHLHIEGLAVSPNEVWLEAVRGPDRLILRFPKEAFLQVARERWVPAEVPKEDVQTRLATWTPHQQALYHVFAGNHATAINLLQAEVQSEPPAESLFLLALVHDELGAAQPDKARAYADQLIASHPESVLAAALQFERRSPRSVPPGVRSPVQPTTPP
jgi:hypothetical protein